MKNKIIIAIFALLIWTTITQAQVGINEDNSQPDASALLDVKSTDKGYFDTKNDNYTDVQILAILLRD